MKKLFSILLAGLMVVSLAACSDKDETDDDLDAYVQEEIIVDNYTNEKGQTFYFDSLDSESVTITGYEGSDVPHAVEIPSEILGKKVAAIKDSAFYGLSNITAVTVPDTVTSIGSYAFACCSQLESIVIPANVEVIEDGAFFRCSGLKSLTFEAGSKMTAIPECAFKECSSLESLTVPGNIKTIGVGAFHDCVSLKTIVIEEGVEVIGNQAFQNCKALESLTLPASITKIESKEIVTEDGKVVEENFNFRGCDALYIEGVTLPANQNCVAAKYIASLELQHKPADPEVAA